jgi:hypothetical protein
MSTDDRTSEPQPASRGTEGGTEEIRDLNQEEAGEQAAEVLGGAVRLTDLLVSSW